MLLKPAATIMLRLRYPAKLSLIGAVFVLPLALVMFFFLKEINANINFAHQERQGLEYYHPVSQMLQNLLQHEDSALAVLRKESGASAKREELKATIARNIEEIEAVEKRLGTDLKTTKSWEEIKTALNDLLAGKENTTPAECLKQHQELAGKLADFITTIGNNSNLVLDPDVDSYYLMDTLLTQSPQLFERVAEARDFATDMTARSSMSSDEKTHIVVLKGQADTVIGTLLNDVKQAVGANKDVNPATEASLAELKAATDSFQALLDKGIVQPSKLHLSGAESQQAGNAVLTAAAAYREKAFPVLDGLLKARADRYIARRNAVTVFTIVMLLLAIYLFAGFYRATMSSITTLLDTAKAYTLGDLSRPARLEARDEVGKMGQETLEQMAEVVRTLDIKNMATATKATAEGIQQIEVASQSIRQAIQEMDNSSEEVSRACQEVAKASEYQARGNTEVATNMNSLSIAISQVNAASSHQREIAQQANITLEQSHQDMQEVTTASMQMSYNATKASKVAESGGKALEETLEMMKHIQDEVTKVAECVIELGRRSEEIGAIVETIDQIAEQTDLLALNAAIEAARAGEHGKGFAVVADEVRKLAERATDATREIGKLVKTVQEGVHQAVEATSISQNEVTAGVAKSHQAEDALNRIRESVQLVSDRVEDVLVRTNRMAGSLDQTRQSMGQVLTDTDANEEVVTQVQEIAETVLRMVENMAASSQQSAAAAEQLSASAAEVSHNLKRSDGFVQIQTDQIAQVSVSAERLQQQADRILELFQQEQTGKISPLPLNEKEEGLRTAA